MTKETSPAELPTLTTVSWDVRTATVGGRVFTILKEAFPGWWIITEPGHDDVAIEGLFNARRYIHNITN